MDRHGNPALEHRVRVEYDIPGMGMMHRTGTFMLHDDGTHGDMMPHDGLYCYEDTSNEFGCHGANAMPGEYHFEFCGIGRDGRETNRMDVRATRVQ